MDLRTCQGREEEVLEQIREYGGFSCFWLEDPTKRWAALDRLTARGVVKVEVLGYPRYGATIVGE